MATRGRPGEGLGGEGGSLGDALEEVRDVGMTLPARYGKWSGSIIPSLVHIGPALQQGLHDREMTLLAGYVQRSDAIIPSLVHIGPGLQ